MKHCDAVIANGITIVNQLFKFCIAGLLLSSLHGCMTFSGDQLTDLEPIKPVISPVIQISVGAFTAQFDEDSTLTAAAAAGKIINDKIIQNWKEQGYISDFSSDENANVLANTQYSLLLQGSQQDSSSTFMKIISALTFLIIPATIETSYELSYELTEVKTGEKYRVKIADNVNTTTWLLFFPAIPFSSAGSNTTFDRFAEHLYQGFVKQGAFQAR
ncbi:hypothetical protein [Methyloprofundus sp.]|uniref:hypothetical protein n=1 Tax=Methyloprofundus sp. TaxID=2020875 RepID=UPI003D133829